MEEIRFLGVLPGLALKTSPASYCYECVWSGVDANETVYSLVRVDGCGKGPPIDSEVAAIISRNCRALREEEELTADTRNFYTLINNVFYGRALGRDPTKFSQATVGLIDYRLYHVRHLCGELLAQLNRRKVRFSFCPTPPPATKTLGTKCSGSLQIFHRVPNPLDTLEGAEDDFETPVGEVSAHHLRERPTAGYYGKLRNRRKWLNRGSATPYSRPKQVFIRGEEAGRFLCSNQELDSEGN
ncbi:ORF58 [Anguillid herpesvirus 1]|uniref:Protein ORF58 n=1 Tax=Anguillid herpesvirus 1 TaxID=150286 RepID=A0A1J0REF0_9VIRU|nr:ORF58 [Anguillid herpesvirus 1]QRM16481.1 protein ORF58 [Anguillid herpesvirus 1]QRM16744.1 protein ORF58 [Anguillid herpesvirus 1]QRM16875.1 protein ORF58 [Anguillid herpesvirus 1]QRM17005.1 protein ORF58 [Anguillid herpesvirus 1]